MQSLTDFFSSLALRFSQAASRTAAYDIGFVPSRAASQTTAKFIYLLNADDFDPATIPQDAFVVYQGHHGDHGAQYADVCLPGSAYTEKNVTWINTEGRAQLGRAAVGPPGASREDWKIVRAVSESLGATLPYDDLADLRERMWNVSPTLVHYDAVDRVSMPLVGIQHLAGASAPTATNAAHGPTPRTGSFIKPIVDFYRTDPISRACVLLFLPSISFVCH